MSQRRGGLVQLQINGESYDVKTAPTYGLGTAKRDAIVGADGIHGYKETPQPAFIETAFTDRGALDVKKLMELKDATVTMTLANGKTVVLRDAWYADEGSISTEEGEIGARFEANSGEEIS